jgi:two-component sensor histidine kinase
VEAEVTLEFRDNGPGFPENISPADGDIVGLSLIRRIVEHTLSGQVRFHNNQGAIVTIQFKADQSTNFDWHKSN